MGAAGAPHHLKADQSQLGSTCSLPSTWARDLRYWLRAQDVDARRDHDSAGRGRRFWVTPIHTLKLGRRSGDHRAQPLRRGCLRGRRMGGGGSRYGQAFWPQDPWVLSTSSADGGATTGRSALHAGHGGSRSCPRGASVSSSQSPHGGARGLDGGTRGLQSWGQSRAGCTHFDYKVLVRCRALMSARFQWKSQRSLQGQGQGQHPDLSDLLIQNPTSSNEGPLFSPRSGAKPWGYSREPWHEAPFVQGLQRPVSKGIIRIL